MKYYDVIKCKRLALGMTQAEFGEIIGVSGGTVSKFEKGEPVSDIVFDSIRYEVDMYIKGLDRLKQLEFSIKSKAYSLEYESNEEKIRTLNYLIIEAGKLNLELFKEKESY